MQPFPIFGSDSQMVGWELGCWFSMFRNLLLINRSSCHYSDEASLDTEMKGVTPFSVLDLD
jgi:hypothetical protein